MNRNNNRNVIFIKYNCQETSENIKYRHAYLVMVIK